jgi:hypothetical protein
MERWSIGVLKKTKYFSVEVLHEFSSITPLSFQILSFLEKEII